MVTGSILSDQAYGIFQYFNAIAGIAMSVLGIPTNLLNIRTFVSMGVEDGVTVSFLSLSISDLASSILNLANSIALALHAYEYYSGTLLCYYDPLFFIIVFANLCFMTYTITVLNTTFLAITRCMCIVMPIQFKNIFTAKRAFIVAVACALVTIAITAPIFFKIDLKPYQDNSSTLDCSRQVLSFPEDREDVKDVVYLIILTILPFTSQIIVLICMVAMVYILKKSRYIRRSIRRSSKKRPECEISDDDDADVSSETKDSSEVTQIADIDNNENSKDSKFVRFLRRPSDLRRSLRVPKRFQKFYTDVIEESKTDKTCTGTTWRTTNTTITNTPKSTLTTGLRTQSSPALKGMDTGDQWDVVKSPDGQPPRQQSMNTSEKYETKDIIESPSDSLPAEAPLSHKESRVVQQVVLICAIFVLCNIPMIAMGVASMTVPQLDASFQKHAYVRMYYSLQFLRRVIEQLSSSINFFIYMKYNSKFRYLTKRFLKKMAIVKLVRGRRDMESSATDQITTNSSCSKV